MENKTIQICLFTDTICDSNGVSRFLQDMAKESQKTAVKLDIISSTVKTYCDDAPNIHIMKPFFRIKMPFYKELDLVLPPYREISQKVKELQPDMIHISTPGFIGMIGIFIAWRNKIPLIGTYHTDFPSYVYFNTNSKILKTITAFYMKIFYKKFRCLITRSKEYIENIEQTLKIDRSKIFFLYPGTNIKTFSPKYYDKNIWDRCNVEQESFKFLYVGRLTKEKNLDILFDIWKSFHVQSETKKSYLFLVGTGDLDKYQEELASYNIIFLGHKSKEELSSLYASATIFVFPSTTDTLGQVVLESIASSTPVIVTNKGGPCEIIKNSPHKVGFVLDIENKDSYIELFDKIQNGEIDIERLSKNSYLYSKNFSIEKTFESFVDIHRKCLEIKKR